MIRLLTILIFCITLLQITYGQNTKTLFYNIGIEEGLSHNMVTSIAEDSLGFIWFATQDGLNRYDGYDFKVYRIEDNNSTILKNFISEIRVDSYNQLWINYMSGGISRFDPITEIFHHYKPDSTVEGSISSTIYKNYSSWLNSIFFEDSENNMWILTNNGVNRYIRESDSFESLTHDPFDANSLSDNRITCITEDCENNLWIGSANGLNRYNPYTKKIVRFMPDLLGDGLNDSLITVVKAFSDSSIWVGTIYGGLNVIKHANSKNQKIEQYINISERENFDPSIYSIYQTISKEIFVGSRDGLYHFVKNDDRYFPKLLFESSGEYIYYFIEDNKGSVWIGSNLEQSLMIFNPVNQSLRKMELTMSDEYGYKGEAIMTFYASKTGLLWIGCGKGGVYKVNLKAKEFYLIDNNTTKIPYITNKDVYCIYEDEKRNLYVGHKDGVEIINLNNNALKKLKGEREFFNNITYRYSNKLPSNLIGVIKETADHKIWFGAFDNKVSLYNPMNDSSINFHHNPNDDSSYKAWSVRTICITNDGDTYIGGTSEGLCKLNPDGLSFSYFPIVKTGDNTGVNDDRINIIYEDIDKILWIGTMRGGLNMYNPKTNLFKHYIPNNSDTTSISNDHVNCIHISDRYDKNTIWIGTMGGLNKFNKKTQTFTSYTIADGMPSNAIQGILEDDNGKLWISTNNGLVKFDPITENIIVYTKEDGLQGDKFNENAYFKNNDGVMYFGGVNGLTYFNPDDIIVSSSNPNITFTSFKLFNKIIKTNDTVNNHVLLKNSIAYADEVFLNYTNKIISFEFASLHYVAQNKIKYKYKLEGFENEWNEVGYKQRFANYTNLPSGDYTLKVISTNSDGHWSDPAEIVIHITPPYWKTIWFRMVMAFFILSLVLILIRFRTQSLLKQKRILEDTVYEKTKDLSEVNVSLEETQEELSQQNEELIQTNAMLIEREEELIKTNKKLQESEKDVLQQNNELLRFKNHLEEMIKVRTSALKTAKIKAEESDRLKSSFLANMSHEIRTPLNAIVGFSSLFSEDISKEETQEYVTIIQNNSKSLLTIISDIIDISSIQVGQLKIVKSVFNIDQVLNELKSFYNLKSNYEVEILFLPDNSDKTTQINNDSNRFRQIVNNLLGNSIKFTQKGFVKFGYQVIESNVRFYVHDSGPGIAQEAQANIFQYFNKVNIEKGKFHEGTGLGLAISKHLVEQMGGKIWFESELNKGTKFMFELPY